MIYGRHMKPTKKLDFRDKLLELFFRINKEQTWYDQRDSYTKADKEWVTKLLKDVGLNDLTKLCREDMQHCNQLWRDYETNK